MRGAALLGGYAPRRLPTARGDVRSETVVAPSSANASAAASPMPLPAPMIQAIFPASLGMDVSPLVGGSPPHAIERVCLWRGKRSRVMTTVLNDAGEATVAATDGLWLSADDAMHATGWALKPEGMCRPSLRAAAGGCGARRPCGCRCVLATARASRRARCGQRDLGARRQRGSAQGALVGLTAPDFTLPDLAGVAHTLSALRGSKVFLGTWASW